MCSEYLKRADVQGHLKVKEVLVAWDPIRTSDPGYRLPEEEYERHAIPLMSLLDANASEEKMIDYFRMLCVESLNRPFDLGRAKEAIDELKAFWPLWKQSLSEDLNE